MEATMTAVSYLVSTLGVFGTLALVVPSSLVLLAIALRPKAMKYDGKVVVITGGSSGIGKALAVQLVAAGAHVALLARRAEVLATAKAEVEKHRAHPDIRVTTHAIDVSDVTGVIACMADIIEAHGDVHAIVCSAGVSQPQKFGDISAEDWEHIYRVNVVGVRNVVAAALPILRKHEQSRICIVGSQAGQVGVFGYSAYSASKFAIRGFAECLAMELVTTNIKISISCPPDTDTPMLREENKIKPEELKLITSSPPATAEQVASDIFYGMARGYFTIATGIDGFMLANLTGGMSPATFGEMLLQACLSGPFRVIAWVVRLQQDSTVRNYYRQKITPKTTSTGTGSPRKTSVPSV